MLWIALAAQEVTRAASDGAVVWALLGIITTLTAALGAFIRSVLRERDYWRDAFLEEQAQTREIMTPTVQLVQAVFRALPGAGAVGPPGDPGP